MIGLKRFSLPPRPSPVITSAVTSGGEVGTGSRFVLLPVLLLAVAGCSRDSAPPPATAPPAGVVLATVGSEPVTAPEFLARAVERHASGTESAKAALLEEMIQEESLVQRARAAGLDTTPEYRRAMRQFLISRLEEKELLPLLATADNPTEAEVDAAMRAVIPPPAIPQASRRYAWIHLTASPAEHPEALARLKAAGEKFAALPAAAPSPSPAAVPSGFGTVAAEFSDDTDTRYQGGDLGWLSPDALAARLPADTLTTVEALPVGQLHGPLPLKDGVCLLLATAERSGTFTPSPPPREKIRADLIARRRREITDAFRQSAKENPPVQINQEALRQLPIPSSLSSSPAVPAP